MTKDDYLIDDLDSSDIDSEFSEFEDEDTKFNRMMENYDSRRFDNGPIRSKLNNTEFGSNGLNASDMEIYQEMKYEERHQEQMKAIDNVVEALLLGKRFR